MKSSKRSTNAGLSRLFFASGDSATGKLITNVGWTSVGSTFSSNTSFQSFHAGAAAARGMTLDADAPADRKSTRLNSSHSQISYAVFCLKKKKHNAPARQYSP